MNLSPFFTELKLYFHKKKKDCIYWKNNMVIQIIQFFKKPPYKKYTNDVESNIEEEEHLILFNY